MESERANNDLRGLELNLNSLSCKGSQNPLYYVADKLNSAKINLQQLEIDKNFDYATWNNCLPKAHEYVYDTVIGLNILSQKLVFPRWKALISLEIDELIKVLENMQHAHDQVNNDSVNYQFISSAHEHIVIAIDIHNTLIRLTRDYAHSWLLTRNLSKQQRSVICSRQHEEITKTLVEYSA